ncbi:MAG TPA: outer membrane protein assembly factor BamE [Lacipirellulaceae bacterium]|nr:outer membrane protein assembly factor BamE [Lacipirellulaceae bacterium]
MTVRTLFLATVAALALGACSPQVDQRGHVATPGALEKLRPGEQTRNDVLTLLGSPSTTATFDNETWYYISQRVETLAFLAPETKEQKVVALRFDSAGVLQDMNTYTLEDGRPIDMVGRSTPTAGKELTILEQIFGNIGRFGGGGGYVAPSTLGQ